MYTIELKAEAENKEDFILALEYAGQKLREGNTFVDLRNEQIPVGSVIISADE